MPAPLHTPAGDIRYTTERIGTDLWVTYWGPDNGQPGQPMRTQALAYAKQIGADLVVCAVAPIRPELHPVNHLVMDSPGGYITTYTTANVYGNSNLNGDVNGFGNYDGSGTATTTTYVPPRFHAQQTYNF